MTAAPESSARVARLVLWRHGRTEWNAEGRFQGQLDPPLDTEGHRQAEVAAAHLVSALELTAADTVVVSSDLERTVQTASVLTGLLGVPLQVDARLREHGLGSWEGLTRDEVAARFPEQYSDWTAGRPVRGRGGEEPPAVGARALAVVDDLPPARVAVLVTHGGTSGRLLEALLGLGHEHQRLFGPLGNCAWTEAVPHGARWRVLRHNWSPLGELSASRAGGAARGPRGSDAPGEPPPVQDADAVA